MKSKIRYITYAAIIAAVYAVLTMVTWQFSSLAIQVRVAESLCVLILYTPAAVPGMFVGCLIANLMSGTWVDVIFGSLATLFSAVITKKISSFGKYLIPLPTILINTLTIPFVLYYGYGITAMGSIESKAACIAIMALSVFIGESISCYGIGIPLMKAFDRIWPVISRE